MQKIVGKVFLDDVALVAAANDEVINAVVGVGLEDVPQDGLTADLNHGFGLAFFADTSTKSTR